MSAPRRRRTAWPDAEISQAAAITVRTDPITDEEVQYLKYMEDTSELAKFDQYVESFIDHKLSRGVLFWW